ncbi:MAG: hypothetical protein P4L58_01330, partial [Candidatus Pacebacteria bacterium]|nr:hypothetical protein [Candidatus Paceibacterota bacterium]
MEETERKKIIRIKPGERKKQPAVDLGVAGGITPAEKDFKEKVAGRVQVKQDEINNLIYERIAKDQLPDNGGEDLFKKKRIEQLTKEIEELNKRVQQSYKMENYTVRKSGNVEPDVEKMVLEKEAEIRKLEKEIGGNEIDNPKPGEEQGTVPGGVQAIEKDEESVRDKEDNKATDEPQLPKPATVEAGQDNEAQAAENISKANSFDELRSEIERIGIINGSKENFSAADLNRIITTAELFFEKNPDQFTFTKEALLGSLVAITGTFGIRDKVIELVLKRHAELHENNEVIENEAVNSNRESAQEKDEEKKDWDGRYAKPEEIIDAEFKEVEPLRITDQNFRGENAEKLNQLENELDHLRKEYLEVDYKKNTGYKRLGKIFGRSFQNKESKLVENDQDIAWYRAHYDDKLMDYKSALLDDWKVKGSTPERLAEIAKIFETEANINMADGHTRTKVEHQEGRMGKGMVDLMDKTIRNYRNLSFKQKLAISAAFGIAGVGAGLTGSAFLIGGAATAATIRRFFLGTVTGTSAALSAESMTQRNREKSVEKNTAKLVKQFEGKAPKEIEELARERINGLIYDEDQKINTIKNKNLRNLGVGIGVGLASALAVPEFMKHGKEWISHAGIGEKIAGVFGYHHAGSVKLGGGIL